MMFIVRSIGVRPEIPGIEVKLSRDTPPIVKDRAGKTDFFCVGDAEGIAALRDSGWHIVELRDGYYEDGRGGGVAIWGQGRYWEIRSDPLTVTEAVGPGGEGRQPRARGNMSRCAARSSAHRALSLQVELSLLRDPRITRPGGHRKLPIHRLPWTHQG